MHVGAPTDTASNLPGAVPTTVVGVGPPSPWDVALLFMGFATRLIPRLGRQANK